MNCVSCDIRDQNQAPASFFFFSFLRQMMGKKQSFISPHFHVFSQASCVDENSALHPHRIFNLQDALDKLMHFLPQLSDFVPL